MKHPEGGSNSTELILTPEKIISQREILAGSKNNLGNNKGLDTTIGITRKDSFDPENINGKVLYERMIQSPQYRIFIGQEEELLGGMGADLASKFRKDRVSFWDYGCGNGTKATHLIDPVISSRGGKSTASYFGVDISGLYVDEAAEHIEQIYNQKVNSYGIRKDFLQGGLDYQGGVNIAMFLGGTMGNYSDEQIKEIIDLHLYRHRSQKVVGVITLMKEVSGEKDKQRQLEAYGGMGEGYGDQQTHEDFSQFFIAWLRALQCDEKSLTCLKYNTWFAQDEEGQKLVGGVEVTEDCIVEPIKGYTFTFTKGDKIPMMVSRRFSPNQLTYFFGKGGLGKRFEYDILNDADCNMMLVYCSNIDHINYRRDNKVGAAVITSIVSLFLGLTHFSELQNYQKRDQGTANQISSVLKKYINSSPRQEGQTVENLMLYHLSVYVNGVMECLVLPEPLNNSKEIKGFLQDEIYNKILSDPTNKDFDRLCGGGYDEASIDNRIRLLSDIIYNNQSQWSRYVGVDYLTRLNSLYFYKYALENSIGLGYGGYEDLFNQSKEQLKGLGYFNMNKREVLCLSGKCYIILLQKNGLSYAFLVDENCELIYNSFSHLSDYNSIEEIYKDGLKDIRKPTNPIPKENLESIYYNEY